MILDKPILLLVVGSVSLTLGILGTSIIPIGTRELSSLETIRSIPYPAQDGAIYIDEPLAHVDLYVGQPVLAKKLVLTVQYIPVNVTSLDVGVRDASFWLSYSKHALYTAEDAASYDPQPITTTVSIPLTDKLQEPDQSVDLMFFAAGEKPAWKLVSLTAEVHHTPPSWPQFKDYARAIVYRERAL